MEVNGEVSNFGWKNSCNTLIKTSGHTALGASLLSAEWVTDCIYMLASQQQEYGDRSGYTRQRIICESWIKHAYLSIAAAAVSAKYFAI